jgi:hypothetical protein
MLFRRRRIADEEKIVRAVLLARGKETSLVSLTDEHHAMYAIWKHLHELVLWEDGEALASNLRAA